MNNTIHALALFLIDEIGPLRYKALIEVFGDEKSIFEAGVKEIVSVGGISTTLAHRISSKESLKAAETEMKKAEKIGIKILTRTEDEYPYELKNIPDPPIAIYVKGELKKSDYFSVAIVGSRRATPYGMSVAKKISRELSSLKIATVSGLARGIDTETHKSTLEVSGRTIAVLGNALNRFYPPENRTLQEKIAQNGGAVISEFKLDTTPEPGYFPRRNRIISALSLATVVVEADETSGSLITARCASEQGKDVFAVPGSIFSKYSKGTHLLLKQGAKVLVSVNDIIDEIMPLAKWISKYRTAEKKGRLPDDSTSDLDANERKIAGVLSSDIDGISIETIESESGLSIGEISETLLKLELKGVVRSLPGKKYLIVKQL